MVGKCVDLTDSYKSVNEALRHAGMKNHVRVKIEHVDLETIDNASVNQLAKYDAILVPGGFGKRGIEGKITTALRPRTQGALPGHLLGMQVATIEFARHVAGLEGRQQHRVRTRMRQPRHRPHHRVERCRRHHQDARRQFRPGRHHAPGRAKLRRGPETRWPTIYGDVVTERHRHRLRGQRQLPGQIAHRPAGDFRP